MIETLTYNLDISKKTGLVFDGLKKNEDLLNEIKHRQQSVTYRLGEIDKYIDDPDKTDSRSLTEDIIGMTMFLDRLFGQLELVSILLKNSSKYSQNIRDMTYSLEAVDNTWVSGKQHLKNILDKEAKED